MNIKEIDEYYNDQVKFLYPYLKIDDFKKIMEHGFLVFNDLNKRGADVSIGT
jgi:predicted nucleotide-binding protein (sugar kinase/HSP70/actin superfamily)